MNRILVALLGIILIAGCSDNNKKEITAVKEIINRVNVHWQTTHSPNVRAFWDHAAYHTGNMEVYKLLGDSAQLQYSIDWADFNDWKGAKCENKAEWRYVPYGEGQEMVMFGDWQVCFQTYLDLNEIAPDEKKIARAKEVMEYEISTPQHDYWWWADGLYMVMPVMTKLYRATGNDKFLDKLYEYITYSDSIMYDPEEGLYYRDAKYVYPEHQSLNKKKDFWARGDGWVLAGLAKVIQDLPEGYEHREFFVEKYKKMAKAVAACQQPEGYWTRSMYDKDHAPGPETSGTAFFTYGLLWGINNNYLSREEFLPVVENSWKYLTEVALQPDGSIGYVQPIGERAIPGQTVDKNSVANFGVGAFLLAACERVRFLEK